MNKNDPARKARLAQLRREYLREHRQYLITKCVMTVLLSILILYLLRDRDLTMILLLIGLCIIFTVISEIRLYKKQWLPAKEAELDEQEEQGD